MKKKKKNLSLKISTNNETESLLKTVIAVFVCFLFVYGFIMLLNRYGVFEKGYEAPNKKETEISYEYILAGTIFNRMDNEYYVVFDKFETEKSNIYLKYIIDSSSVKIPIYKINMNIEANSQYYSDVSNPKVQKVRDLKIKDVTLIKIKNGKNVLYLDDIEEIKNELIK